jgi:hypothetical protein
MWNGVVIRCVYSARSPERPAQYCHEIVQLDRPLDEVVGPSAEGLNRQLTLALVDDQLK